MEILATTVRGLEGIAIEEIKELTGRQAQIEHRGLVALVGSEEDVFVLNYLSKSLYRVLILLVKGKFSSLEDIYKKVKSVDFVSYLTSKLRFAVRAKRIGDHNFNSMDVEREIGQAVIDAYRLSTGKRLGVDLNHPQVVMRAEVRDNDFWVALDTTGQDSLHKRGYRAYEHPAPLNPVLGYCLIRLSGWNETKSLLDPMCGSGTICIEAALWANRIPNWNWRGYILRNLPFLDTYRLEELRWEMCGCIENKKLNIRGCDLFEKHVKGARVNAREAGVNTEFFKGDATKIPLDSDVVVCNLPYGVRVGSKKRIIELYEEFISNLYNSNWERVVLLTGRPKFLPPRPNLRDSIDIIYGNLPCSVFILEED